VANARSIIQRALVYGTLAVGLVGVVVLIVGGLSLILPEPTHPVLPLLAAGLSALLYQPSKARLQRLVNRLTYGQPEAPNTALLRLGQQLESALQPDIILPTIVETVALTLRVPSAAISIKRLDSGDFELAAQYRTSVSPGGSQHYYSLHSTQPLPGHEYRRSGDLVLPLEYQSEIVGQLIVAPRAPDSPLLPAERALLVDVARRAGAAAHVVRLTHDLRRARERLVLAREEERRRLRRNLHDTIGPTLAALNLKAGAVRTLIARDPALAEAQMGELREQIRAVITDIRRVVYDLRPPALDELGMLPAIREQAAQFSVGGLNVVVEAPEQLPPLPAAIEVAIYRIVLEALTNVERHAQARHCWIKLSVSDQFHIEVTDDGVGPAAERSIGVGITSMRERTTELGGTCTIVHRPQGGTRVLASLPLNVSVPGVAQEEPPLHFVERQIEIT
jgi:signal transduction histidine kinase